MTQPAVSEDIRILLQANAALIGITGIQVSSFEWNAAANGVEKDNQILVLDTEAIDTDQKDIYEQPTFIIQVRGKKNESGKDVYNIARAIYEFLINQPSQSIVNGSDTTDYLQYEPVGSLFPLGKDDNNRHNYIMTFFTFRNPT